MVEIREIKPLEHIPFNHPGPLRARDGCRARGLGRCAGGWE